MSLRYGLAVALILALAGCSSVPPQIRDPNPGNPSISAVRTDSEYLRNKTVRWGGTIISVENKKDGAWIEMLGKPLGSFGRPEETDASEGRFLVHIGRFLDPAVYEKGREMTVYGKLSANVVKPIDEYDYTYPVVDAGTIYLWQEYVPYHYYTYYPYFYYPYAYPYRGYYRYPFYHPFYY